MNLKRLIPKSIKQYIRTMQLRQKFGCNISTHRIHNSVILGKNTSISENVDLRKNVKIGDYSYINRGTLVASGEIGKYCSVGYNCQIGIFEHPTNFISTSPHIYRNVYLDKDRRPKWSEDDINYPPKIGNDVWIGSNALIMQGVTIGDGAIIAANAVVTKDVEPYCIVGGVPAKIIRKRFSDEEIEVIKYSKWWDKSEEWINKNINEILNIDTFIKNKDLLL